MDVAMVGCGDVAGAYAAGLEDRASLDVVAVADRDVDRAEAFGGERGWAAFPGVEPMLAEAEPALVVNLTSHGSHAGVTRACLEAGVHVYSEKPLALDAGEAVELVELAEARGLGLGCAPRSHRGDHQRLAAARLADGTTGSVRVVQATANVGRVSEWHDRPSSYIETGPVAAGGVYPLTLLVEWFGPVTRVRSADVSRPTPGPVEPAGPTHVEATMDLRDGPLLRLSASLYVPHVGREFYGLEAHGDDGSVYLRDAGDLGGGRDPLVSVVGAGDAYTPVPLQRAPRETPLAEGPAALAGAIRRGGAPVRSARRAAHLVGVDRAIAARARSDGPVAVDDCGVVPSGLPRTGPGPETPSGSAAVRLPPVGLGCSRYRDGEYVDRVASVETALDAGYRLLDSAELYGNEARIGAVLDAPGSPDPDSLVLVSKVWNTNHGHVREACETTASALGVSALDCYLLHWPTSWEYTGPLVDLAEVPPDEREARTFPRDASGEPVPGEVSLAEAWRGLEGVHEAGLARTIGLCNVDRETLSSVLDLAEVPPTIVQVERHPYRPRRGLVEWCHERGIRVMAHSPLSAPGLMDEPVLADVATAHGATPAQVVLAWNVAAGVVPVPSSGDPEHLVENLAAAGLELSAGERARIDGLADPDFER